MNIFNGRLPRLFFLLFLMYAITACKKNTGKINEPTAALVTGKGEPTGAVTEKIIGAEGGTITSADGFITVTVPAGAVTSNTKFGIQPITNTLYNVLSESNETAYRLTPEGITFSKPVEVTRTFTPEQMQGKMPELFAAAFQTADGTWKAVPGRMNKTTRQYSFKTTHFSDWSVDGLLSLIVPDKTVAPGETVGILLRGLVLINDDDLIAALVPGVRDIQWSVIQRAKGVIKVNQHNQRMAEFTANSLQQTSINNFAEISVKLTGRAIKVLDESLPDQQNSFNEVTLLTTIEILGNTYMKGTFMGVPVDMTLVQAFGNAPGIGINASKDGLTISLITSAAAAGTYPCGSLLEFGKSEAGATRVAGSQISTYTSLYFDCSKPPTLKYADAAVVIKKWGKIGEPVEGSYQGNVYIQDGTTSEGCPIYKTHLLDVEFRTIRSF